MTNQPLGPYISVASLLLGSGLFAVLYPAVVRLFAPKVYGPHHQVFLVAGVVFLVLSGVLFWMGRSRFKAR